MTITQLITKVQVAKYWPLSQNLDDSRINPWIIRAQESRLKQLLSPPLYQAALAAFPFVAGDRFDKLFNGDLYKYATNFDEPFAGCTELLAAYSYAYIVDNNPTHITRAGVSKKVGDNSVNATEANTSYKSSDAYTDAIRLEGEFYRYMSIKGNAVYPEWLATSPANPSSPMFFNASRKYCGRNARYERGS